MSTYGELDRTAAASQQAMRSLAHETISISEPGEMYWLLGRLNSTVRSLQQVLYQVANAHQDHAGRAAAGPDRDGAGGRALAVDACRQVRRAADLLEGAQTFLDDGQRASGRITWKPTENHGAVAGCASQAPSGTAAVVRALRPDAGGRTGRDAANSLVRRAAAHHEGPVL